MFVFTKVTQMINNESKQLLIHILSMDQLIFAALQQ